MKYIKITDKTEAFEYINEQEWSPHYKSIARYRWKLRHTPETIKKRTKECSICYEKRGMDEFEKKKDLCCHTPMVCRVCMEKVYSCPFCRAQWKQKQHNVIVFRVPVSLLNDVFSRNDQEIFDTVVEILHQISPEPN
jgi:hypothetical protein